MEELVKKIGHDKFAHLGIGGLIAAFFTIITAMQEGAEGWSWVLWSVVGWIVVAVVEFFKEFIIDEKPDWKDIAWTMGGPLIVTVATIIGALLHIPMA